MCRRMASTASSALTPNGDGGHENFGVGTGEERGHVSGELQRNISKLVDLRGSAKLTPFSGAEADWPDWRFRTRALGPLLGL